MHHMADINWLAVFVVALAGFIVGGLWYGPLFQKPWMQHSGMTKEKGAQGNMVLTFGTAYAMNVIAATGLCLLIGPHRDWLHGLHTGLMVGLFFVATGIATIYVFEMRALKLFLINAGYQVVNLAAMGVLLAIWPW
jgi:hypothetical protein